MSFPHPPEQHTNRTERGEQPYADDKSAMSENEARLQSEAEAFGESRPPETPEQKVERLAAERTELLDRAGRAAAGEAPG